MFPQKHPFLPFAPYSGRRGGDEGLLMVGQALDRSVQEPNLFESQLANQLANLRKCSDSDASDERIVSGPLAA